MAENMNESTTSEQEQDNEGGTITLNEMLELEDDLIEQSAAVLGAANDKSCSFIEVSLFSPDKTVQIINGHFPRGI